MDSFTFSQDFEVCGQIQELKIPQKINLVKRKNFPFPNHRNEFLSVHFPKDIDFESFSKLRRFKYISVIQPEAYYDNETNEYILIYLNYLKCQLNQKKLDEFGNNEHANRIFLQLALLFAELEKRNYKWPLEYLEQLYYIDGLLYLSLADYDFNSPNLQLSCLDQFRNFASKYFPQQLHEILQMNLKTLNLTVNHFCKKHIKYYDFMNDRINHENVLKYFLFNKQQEKEAMFSLISKVGSNSVVKEFKTPLNLLELHPILQNEEQKCIFKVIIMKEKEKGIILKRMDREIDLMEENQSQYIAVCSLYLRINDTPFLIMKKHPFILDEILKVWNPTPENLKKDVYAFSYKFAIALNDLHYQKFQHRDLKPDNLFLNKSDLEDSDVIIGDLDRSKRNDENMVEQTEQNLQNQMLYNPPEEKVFKQKQYTYDVFQYGMIVLQMANRGKYIGDENLGTVVIFFNNQFDQYYGSKAINDALRQYNYDQDFIDLIIQCLKINPNERPDSQIIYQVTETLYKKAQGVDQTVLISVKLKSKQEEQQQQKQEQNNQKSFPQVIKLSDLYKRENNQNNQEVYTVNMPLVTYLRQQNNVATNFMKQ